MAEPSTHINYSFEDIQRYLQGKMSAAEMHEIEKAALQDSFLADAIEGYTDANANTSRKNLDEINAALLKEQRESKVVSINRKTQWLRIAAVIIIIAGAGITGIYFFNNSSKEQQIAQVKKESADALLPADTNAQKLNASIAAQNAESTFAQNQINKKEVASLKKRNNPNSNSADKNIQPDKSSVTLMKASPAPVAQDEEADKNFSAALSPKQQTDSTQYILEGKAERIDFNTNTFAGKVIDENNKPIAGAVVTINNEKKGTVTDLNGNFILHKNDSLLNVTASTIGYAAKDTLLTAKNKNVITLKETSDALNEVVVTGYGVKKNKSIKETATPVGGWENFNNYVISKLNKDSTNTKNYIPENDLVELEFLIDKSGNPYNIQITKPLDDERNSKAINILKTGPKWTTTSKQKKAKVVIAF